MPKLYSSKHIIKVLENKGFFFVSQKGSHTKYRKSAKDPLTVIVPHPKKEIPFGTFRSILRQSNLTEVDFENKK
ncbi:type II toxin-antitoxin system HicA family toxin [Candidatus Peregrinibacteria bacterium CG10_big_fil_rev_8_21_14_0_10_36_19]|nr:MAG: type II toxin-antitoxin system HicA family toxin [Candidatus Peregrinibacteria bacterium CG10_big_fil_rev_8_21_14_0_10_36_19]